MERDIVCSAWKHAAGLNSREITSEYLGTHGCESNGILWNSGLEANKEIVRKRKRRTSFISNVLVVSDPKNPDNEGKIFLFKYGKKIFGLLSAAMMPPQIEVDSGEAAAIDPFSLTEGANFKLKIRRVEGYANFDKSVFEAPSSVTIDSSKLFDISKYTDEKSFKSYEALNTRLVRVLGGNNVNFQQQGSSTAKDDNPPEQQIKVNKPVAQVQSTVPSVDDDDDMSFFKSLTLDD